MMKRMIQISAVTRVERHAATSLVLEMINRLGGWVEDTQFFSNKMVSIRFVLPQAAVLPLLDDARQAAILADLEKEYSVTDPQAEQPGSLQMTFLHNEPDLKMTIPAIPG